METVVAMGDEPRGQRIFQGELIVFRALDAMAPLVARADTMIRAAFAPHAPLSAHAKLTPAAYADIAERLIAAFAKDADVADCYQASLVAAGVDPSRVYWDRLRLRIQPPGDSHMSRRVMNLTPHRDTWGSNVLAQQNWWAPIYPVSPERTLIIYPAHWRQPVANTSGDWDYHDLLARRRTGDSSYPLLPVATGRIDDSGAWPCDINPGDLLCFSGAHLHASVPNTTPLTRFSTEVRTVCLDDLNHGRAAPDLDGAAPRQPLEWFNRMADCAPLVSA
ncbi:MAG: hypothetical protein VCD33_10550 [Alphaproteobacteria bacterium]